MATAEQDMGGIRLHEPKKNNEMPRRTFLRGLGILGGSLALAFIDTHNPSDTPANEKERDEQIQTADYFFKKHPEGLIGTHRMSQIVEGNSIYYVKHVSDAYEQYERTDDGDIYLRVDNSNPKKPYTFSNGLFLKNTMEVGQTTKVRNNHVQWYNEALHPVSTNSGRFDYDITLVEHNPAQDIGGTLGIQDTIKLKYDYFTDYEEFTYSKDWGWVGWSLHAKDGSLKSSAVFNEVADKNLYPNKRVIPTK